MGIDIKNTKAARPIRSLKSSRWPNQRTRPSTTKPRRLTRTASRSQRPTDTLRSRAQIPSFEETTDSARNDESAQGGEGGKERYGINIQKYGLGPRVRENGRKHSNRRYEPGRID